MDQRRFKDSSDTAHHVLSPGGKARLLPNAECSAPMIRHHCDRGRHQRTSLETTSHRGAILNPISSPHFRDAINDANAQVFPKTCNMTPCFPIQRPQLAPGKAQGRSMRLH